MSLAACMPSSFRFLSICLLRARAARSSADMAQPILLHVAFTNATPASFLTQALSRDGKAAPPPSHRRAHAHLRLAQTAHPSSSSVSSCSSSGSSLTTTSSTSYASLSTRDLPEALARHALTHAHRAPASRTNPHPRANETLTASPHS